MELRNSISYTAADQMVRMRGGDPTVWDSRARTKAVEIDSNNETHVSVCRGKVQTTYYSQEQTNGARAVPQGQESGLHHRRQG